MSGDLASLTHSTVNHHCAVQRRNHGGAQRNCCLATPPLCSLVARYAASFVASYTRTVVL